MSRFLFSTIDVTRQVFFHTSQSFAIVNLKPILPGRKYTLLQSWYLSTLMVTDVLVSPRRVVTRLADLTSSELADLMGSVQQVGKVIENAYKAEGLTIACQVKFRAIAPTICQLMLCNQDGPAAGQTVPHVHFHLLPRKLAGDPFEGHNDNIYPALESSEANLPRDLMITDKKQRHPEALAVPIKVDADGDRKPRSLEDMEKEAEWLKQFIFKGLEGGSTVRSLDLTLRCERP